MSKAETVRSIAKFLTFLFTKNVLVLKVKASFIPWLFPVLLIRNGNT
jgi:hypothetical protein